MPRGLRAFVPRALLAPMNYVPRTIGAPVPHVSRAIYAFVLDVSRVLHALVLYVLSYLTCSRASRVLRTLVLHVCCALRTLVLFVPRDERALLLLSPHLLLVFKAYHTQMHLQYCSFHVLWLLCFWCLSSLSFLQSGLRLIIVICHFLKRNAITMVFCINDLSLQDLLTILH